MHTRVSLMPSRTCWQYICFTAILYCCCCENQVVVWTLLGTEYCLAPSPRRFNDYGNPALIQATHRRHRSLNTNFLQDVASRCLIFSTRSRVRAALRTQIHQARSTRSSHSPYGDDITGYALREHIRTYAVPAPTFQEINK